MDITEFIGLASVYSVFIPIVCFLARIKAKTGPFRIIAILLAVAAVSDLVSDYLFRQKIPTYMVINTYFVANFVLLSFFYSRVIESKNFNKKQLIGSLVYVVTLIMLFAVQGFEQYQGIAWTISGLILSWYAYAHYSYIQKNPFKADSNLTSYFIVNASVIMYFTMSFVLLLMANYILNTLNPTEARVLWSLHNVNNIMRNAGFAAAFLYLGKSRLNFLTPEQLAYYQQVIKRMS